MHLNISKNLKRLWADKVLDLANLGAGATLFGQFVAGQQFSLIIAIIGLLVVLTGYFISFQLYES